MSKTISETQIYEVLRSHVATWSSQRAFCLACHVDPGYLCRVLQRKQHIGPHLAAIVGYRVAQQRYELVLMTQ